jgi:hypothetical protein
MPRALVVAAMLVGGSARASAAPTEPAKPEAAPAAADTVDAALERGDFDRARTLAKAQRTKDPTPAHWRIEAEVLEQAGDIEGAVAARRGQVAATPKGPERDAARAELDRLSEQARGRVADEPASTHRKDLDARWQAAATPARPKSKATTSPTSERRSPDERVVNKWYFWVTLAAIVASAAAVTGIAIKASRDDKPDALDTLVPSSRPTGGAGFRF